MNKKIIITVGIIALVLVMFNQQKKEGIENRFYLYEIEGVEMDSSVFIPLVNAEAEVRVFPFNLPLNTSRWMWNYSEGGFIKYRQGDPQPDPLGMFIMVRYKRGYFENFQLTVTYDGGQTKTFYLPDLPSQQQTTTIYFYSDIYGSTYYDFELTELARQAPMVSQYPQFLSAKQSYLGGTIIDNLIPTANGWVQDG